VEVDTQGDAFFVAFPTAASAVTATTCGQQALAPGRSPFEWVRTTPTVAAEAHIRRRSMLSELATSSNG
jgi:hypothetical protein